MFVSDDEMQIMGSPTHSRSERVVMPVNMEQPLDPRYVQPTPRRDDDLDVQPSKGPREAVNITGDIIDNYFEENLTDVRPGVKFQCIFATNNRQQYHNTSI